MNRLITENHKAKIRKTTLFLISLIISIVPHMTSAVESEISKLRVRKIASVIKEYTSAKEKLTDPFVQKDILDRVAKEFTLEPDEKPNTTPVSEVAREVRKLVSKRFPNSIKKIKKKAKKEAKKKYKMAEKLDFVTIRVQRGRSNYSVSGVFYGFGVGGKSVRIGDNLPVAYFDLVPSDRAKFDKPFCAEMKKKYISKKIRQYFDKKQSYLNILFHEKLNAVARENEKLGYIYRWDKWRTPKDITENLMKQQIRQQRLSAEEEEPIEVASNPETNDDKTTTKNGPETNEAPMPDTPGAKPADKPENAKSDLRLRKLQNEIEKKQMEIAGSQYGVDADQMFKYDDKLVLIGMPRNEVNLALSGLIPENSGGAVETITFDKGILNKASLFFVNNILYKVEKDYRIGPPEAMKQLLNYFRDSYGDSIEQTEAVKNENERQARLAKIKHQCKKGKHKWTSSGICKACHVKKADLTPPKLKLDQTWTWTGEIITAKVHLKLTPKADNFTMFVLTKEKPQLKEEQDRIMKQDEQDRAEEQKRKQIEEYKKQH